MIVKSYMTIVVPRFYLHIFLSLASYTELMVKFCINKSFYERNIYKINKYIYANNDKLYIHL